MDIIFVFIVKRFLDETAYTGYDISVNGDVQVFLFDFEGFLPFFVSSHRYLVGVQILDDVYLAFVPAGSILQFLHFGFERLAFVRQIFHQFIQHSIVGDFIVG